MSGIKRRAESGGDGTTGTAIERQEAIGEYLVDREEKKRRSCSGRKKGETPKAGDGQKVMTDASAGLSAGRF